MGLFSYRYSPTPARALFLPYLCGSQSPRTAVHSVTRLTVPHSCCAPLPPRRPFRLSLASSPFVCLCLCLSLSLTHSLPLSISVSPPPRARPSRPGICKLPSAMVLQGCCSWHARHNGNNVGYRHKTSPLTPLSSESDVTSIGITTGCYRDSLPSGPPPPRATAP